MMTSTRPWQRYTQAPLMAGLGVAMAAVAAPAPAFVGGGGHPDLGGRGRRRTRLENAIEAAMDDAAAHAVAFTPAVVALLEARLIGGRIFLFVATASADARHPLRANAPRAASPPVPLPGPREKQVGWGNFSRFLEYTHTLKRYLPAGMIPPLGVIATGTEILCGPLLLSGWHTHASALHSAWMSYCSVEPIQ